MYAISGLPMYLKPSGKNINNSLKLQALPLMYFPWLVAMLVGYAVLTQAVKGWYARRYGWQ